MAKATGKSVELVRSTGKFLSQVLGDSMREVGGVIWDKAQYWRFRNQITIIDKVQKILESRAAVGKPVPMPPAFALQVLDAIALESEDEVQDLWAALIANASDPNTRIRIRKVFLDILRGFEPLDAMILHYLSDPKHDTLFSIQTGAKLNAEAVAVGITADLDEAKISIQTLARYGCIIDGWEHNLESVDSGYSGFRVDNPASNFRLSHLGNELIKATRS